MCDSKCDLETVRGFSLASKADSFRTTASRLPRVRLRRGRPRSRPRPSGPNAASGGKYKDGHAAQRSAADVFYRCR